MKITLKELIETLMVNINDSLWLNQWTDGIAEGVFTKYEILDEFTQRGITIPEPLLNDFNNRLWKKRIKYHERF